MSKLSNYFSDRAKLTEDDLDAPSMRELGLMQEFITRWRELTFGGETDVPTQCCRLADEVEEFAGLAEAIFSYDKAIGFGNAESPIQKQFENKCRKELADMLVVMFCVASAMQFDLMDEVKKKMRINLTREWEITGPGVGRHTKKSPYEIPQN